ncbi:MAG TPA: hypothetical protein VFR81_07985 [Longimicrobium sp.]|nr:hypothetical protein [Longimicrobium sp.]
MCEDLRILIERMNAHLEAPGFLQARVIDEDRRILALEFASPEAADRYKFTLETQGVSFGLEIARDAPDTLLQYR